MCSAEAHRRCQHGLHLSLDEPLDCREATGAPVSEDYVKKMRFKSTVELKQAVINLSALPK